MKNEWKDDEDEQRRHGKNLRILYYIRSALPDMLRYIFERIKYQNLYF